MSFRLKIPKRSLVPLSTIWSGSIRDPDGEHGNGDRNTMNLFSFCLVDLVPSDQRFLVLCLFLLSLHRLVFFFFLPFPTPRLLL